MTAKLELMMFGLNKIVKALDYCSLAVVVLDKVFQGLDA
jgi:hypothetical protein